MKRRLICLAIFMYISGVVTPQDGYCVIYKYIDAYGTPCFSDNLQSIPEKSRATALIVSGDAIEKEPRTAKREPPAEETASQSFQESPQHRIVPGSFIVRLQVSSVIAVSALLIYFLILKIILIKWVTEESRDAILVLSRLALLCIVVISVGLLHAGDIRAIFGRVGDSVQSVKQRSADRGKRTAEAMKQLKTMVDQNATGLPPKELLPEEENK